MSTHTPGPWHFGDTAGPIGIAVDRSDCHGFRNHVWIAKNIATESDARLISAAPDLLDCLRRTLDALYNETCEKPDSAWIAITKRDALAAIAKAEGKSE